MKTGKRLWQRMKVVCCTLLFIPNLWSQPFVDLLQLRNTYGFRNNTAEATPFTHLWIGSDVPVKLKEDTYLLFSPTYDQWQIDSADKEEVFPVVHSFSFPVGLIMPLSWSKWSLKMFAVPRWNGEKLFAENTFQFGGATLVTYSLKPWQSFSLGVYANAEFFGLFVVPLFGADWRIDEQNYLFGVLPGRLTFEHQWGQKWYGGVTFRAITHSYRLINGDFIRLDDNQLSFYLDYYITSHICVTMEPGYGLYRKIRTGRNKKEYLTNMDWGDGPFIKLSTSYRLRL